jgi:hypothetical protein
LVTVKNSSGGVEHIVGTGRLSNMVGEIFDGDFTVSLPIFKKEGKSSSSDSIKDKSSSVINNFRTVVDIPSRINSIPDHKGKRVLVDRNQWQGRLPSARVLGTYHSSLEKVSFTRIPLPQQLVLEGRVCSSAYWNGNTGGCAYDRDTEEEGSDTGGGKSSPLPAESIADNGKIAEEETSKGNSGGSSNTNQVLEEDEEEIEDECPVCKYMKGGPCKEEFLLWDTCLRTVQDEQKQQEQSQSQSQSQPAPPETPEDETRRLQKCFVLTTGMLKCMQRHEYYDIMTAGTSFAHLETAQNAEDATDDSASASTGVNASSISSGTRSAGS